MSKPSYMHVTQFSSPLGSVLTDIMRLLEGLIERTDRLDKELKLKDALIESFASEMKVLRGVVKVCWCSPFRSLGLIVARRMSSTRASNFATSTIASRTIRLRVCVGECARTLLAHLL
jgi:hypothetical protein